MQVEGWDVDEALEILEQASEIKELEKLMKAIERKKEEKKAISSLSELRKVAGEIRAKDEDELSEHDLMTDEDRVAIKEKREVDANLKQMGFKVKE